MFYNEYQDPIVREEEGVIRRYINGADNDATGIELTAQAALHEHWLLRTNLSAMLENPDSMFRAAKKNGDLMLSYNHEDLSVTLDLEYMGEREFPSQEGGLSTVPSYTQLHGSVSYGYSDDVRLALSVNNLTNRTTYSPTINAAQNPIENRSREFWLTVDWSWQ